jgi:TetR/AcrR family transcriptional regulator, regulator of cefoperazone and chloramphenicol sensitivity
MHGAGFDDLTARAKIRQAAMAQFTEHGFDKATVRGIAAAAGVSPGLVRHHFGSKQGLREAVDTHVLNEVQRANDEIMLDMQRGDFANSTITRLELRPFMGYLVRALVDGSPIVSTLFDRMVEMTQPWFEAMDKQRTDPSTVDSRTRAAVFNAMALGVPLLHQHLSRVLGVDITSDEGDRLLAHALLDLYSHTLLEPQIAAAARSALEASYPNTPHAHPRRRT